MHMTGKHGYGHMVALMYGVEFVCDIKSYAQVQRAGKAWIQTTLIIPISVCYYLELRRAINALLKSSIFY